VSLLVPGIRLRWIDTHFRVMSYLIACREFNPSSLERDTINLSKILLMWVEDCLEEVGVKSSDLFAAATDKGSDVKCCATNEDYLALDWEWCLAHMINRAIVEAFGYCPDASKSTNIEAREQIMDMRRVGDLIRSSPQVKVIKNVSSLLHPCLSLACTKLVMLVDCQPLTALLLVRSHPLPSSPV
jgi:hypothetical protein